MSGYEERKSFWDFIYLFFLSEYGRVVDGVVAGGGERDGWEKERRNGRVIGTRLGRE